MRTSLLVLSRLRISIVAMRLAAIAFASCSDTSFPSTT